jgi:hypothetical protein
MEVSLPAFAHLVTVFGSTLKAAATSAGVKSVFIECVAWPADIFFPFLQYTVLIAGSADSRLALEQDCRVPNWQPDGTADLLPRRNLE